MIESLVVLILVLVLVGVILWLVNTYFPIPQPIMAALCVIILVLVILWFMGYVPVRRLR